MNIPKHVAGIALFTLIFSVSVFIANLLTEPAMTMRIPPVPIDAPPYNSRAAFQFVDYKVRLVSLDLINRKSYTTLTLKRDADGPAPERIWVYTYFFIPRVSLHRTWTSVPVEIREPFADGDEVSLTVAGACRWCVDLTGPTSEFYANVGVSTLSGEDAQRIAQMKTDIKEASPVLVQFDQKSRP